MILHFLLETAFMLVKCLDNQHYLWLLRRNCASNTCAELKVSSISLGSCETSYQLIRNGFSPVTKETYCKQSSSASPQNCFHISVLGTWQKCIQKRYSTKLVVSKHEKKYQWYLFSKTHHHSKTSKKVSNTHWIDPIYIRQLHPFLLKTTWKPLVFYFPPPSLAWRKTWSFFRPPPWAAKAKAFNAFSGHAASQASWRKAEPWKFSVSDEFPEKKNQNNCLIWSVGSWKSTTISLNLPWWRKRDLWKHKEPKRSRRPFLASFRGS